MGSNSQPQGSRIRCSTDPFAALNKQTNKQQAKMRNRRKSEVLYGKNPINFALFPHIGLITIWEEKTMRTLNKDNTWFIKLNNSCSFKEPWMEEDVNIFRK